jgi:hypothetical protein
MTEWLNVILQGVLIGGLYAMFAAGLSLIFGVMRLVNIAHGDLIVLAAYVALMVTQTLGIDPLTSLLMVTPTMAIIGYALQRGLLNRTLGDDLLPPLLVTFGLSIIIQNGCWTVTADSRKLQAGATKFRLPGAGGVGRLLPLIQFWSRSPSNRLQAFVPARPCLSRHLRRPAGGATDGARHPPRVRYGDGAVARHRRHCRRVPGGARQFRSGYRTGAADLRLRGGDHRRPRQHVGHAHWRHRARRLAR